MTDHKHYHIRELNKLFTIVKGFPKLHELIEWLRTDATIYFLFPVGYKQESTQLDLHKAVKDVLVKVEDETGISYRDAYRRVNTIVLSQEELGTELENFEFEKACDVTVKGITPKQPSGGIKRKIPDFV